MSVERKPWLGCEAEPGPAASFGCAAPPRENPGGPGPGTPREREQVTLTRPKPPAE